MSDFRIKLLGLAALATVFTGISYGQVSCNTSATSGIQEPSGLNTTSPILARAESEAELVSDVVLYCPISPTVSAGQLTVFASLPVSSKAVTVAAGALSGSAGNSEAILQICAPTAVGVGCTPATTGVTAAGTSFYQGTVAGSTVTFSGISFPAGFTAQISNVRMNLSGAAIGSTPLPVTESVFAGTNGLATVVYNNVTVAYGLKSLNPPTITLLTNPSTPYYTVCGSGDPNNGVGGNPLTASFTIAVSETFGGFFKTQTGVSSGTVSPVLQNGEQGSLQSAASMAIGTAASGTEFSVTVANVPSAATIYLPPTITGGPVGGGAGTAFTLALTGTPTVIAKGPFATLVAFTPSSGTVTATYQVTASNPAQVETFTVPAFVAFAPNTVTAQGPITALVAYAPVAALTGQATSVPDFAASANAPLNAQSIVVCQTSLLFPFVTNQVGFDTGIVLSNTSTDPFGANGATAQAGTCTLNFYGAGAPSPNTGVAAPGGSQATGTTNAFQLSSVAPGFQGYMISVCTYLYGHGYAFLEFDLTQGNGVAEGYLPLVITDRGQAPAESFSN
jgi:hypothetical protein